MEEKRTRRINPLDNAEKIVDKLDKAIGKEGTPFFKKYPFTFGILSLSGFLFVLYGFERYLDSTSFFSGRPLVAVFLGLLILLLTGTLKDRISHK